MITKIGEGTKNGYRFTKDATTKNIFKTRPIIHDILIWKLGKKQVYRQQSCWRYGIILILWGKWQRIILKNWRGL